MTDFPANNWHRFSRDEWDRRAGDPMLPYWLRVASLAYASHLNNGHAPFRRGLVATTLGTPGTPYSNVGRTIREAIDYGWLAPESYWGCLVVPRHIIRKGDMFAPVVPCEKHQSRNANPSLSERFEVHSSTPDERFKGRTRHSVSGSERAPLSLICPTQPTGTAG